MSVVCILAPVVVSATWPTLSAAIMAAATSLGYTLITRENTTAESEQNTENRVEIQIEQSELVSSQLGRDQRIRVHRDGVTITFARDARGRASLHASSAVGHDTATLRFLGEELAQGVVQHYVHQRLKDGLTEHQFMIVEEEASPDRTLRLKVRKWEN
ncbi:hypothetical protein Ga0100231_007810 [Opitutaceae bacterium TAV4]|nr:hypothetical protein Ga0100231_007810 [Opitutaceae bacterium TAV4]RRJ98369.1 hypothetical protein Ga0100230_008075 [Opitutaceae bacterium TAV3]